MTDVPKTTVEQYKDWAKRKDVKLNLSDEEIEDALSRANKIAQDHEDKREENKKRTSPQAKNPG